MSISVNYVYGSYIPSNPTYITSYGVTSNIYGVVIYTTGGLSLLLMESGSYLLQENGGKIGLG